MKQQIVEETNKRQFQESQLTPKEMALNKDKMLTGNTEHSPKSTKIFVPIVPGLGVNKDYHRDRQIRMVDRALRRREISLYGENTNT